MLSRRQQGIRRQDTRNIEFGPLGVLACQCMFNHLTCQNYCMLMHNESESITKLVEGISRDETSINNPLPKAEK